MPVDAVVSPRRRICTAMSRLPASRARFTSSSKADYDDRRRTGRSSMLRVTQATLMVSHVEAFQSCSGGKVKRHQGREITFIAITASDRSAAHVERRRGDRSCSA